MATTSPEMELVRRALPLAVPALVVSLVAGAVISGTGAAVSAGLGVALVFANLSVRGIAASRAAQVSPVALAATDMVGFFLRLGVIFLSLIWLNRLDWFSPVAFAASVIPCTIIVLLFEMKQLSGRLHVDLWSFGGSRA
jgi:hypothetical protein